MTFSVRPIGFVFLCHHHLLDHLQIRKRRENETKLISDEKKHDFLIVVRSSVAEDEQAKLN